VARCTCGGRRVVVGHQLQPGGGQRQTFEPLGHRLPGQIGHQRLARHQLAAQCLGHSICSRAWHPPARARVVAADWSYPGHPGRCTRHQARRVGLGIGQCLRQCRALGRQRAVARGQPVAGGFLLGQNQLLKVGNGLPGRSTLHQSGGIRQAGGQLIPEPLAPPLCPPTQGLGTGGLDFPRRRQARQRHRHPIRRIAVCRVAGQALPEQRRLVGHQGPPHKETAPMQSRERWRAAKPGAANGTRLG
jgi:hypothetical protein